MSRDKDLEIAYRQLQAYKPMPPGTSPLMDAVARLWNRAVAGQCVLCSATTDTGMDYCQRCFAEVEREQEAIKQEAAQLEQEIAAHDAQQWLEADPEFSRWLDERDTESQQERR